VTENKERYLGRQNHNAERRYNDNRAMGRTPENRTNNVYHLRKSTIETKVKKEEKPKRW
jgi:hypothetical protein